MEPLSANDPRTIGEFRLHARLGAGGMGQVYLGFSPAGHAVAIKVIHQQFARDQEFLRRFSHEVAAASAVGGMYTAPVVDYDLTCDAPWLATAYVPGPTLATVIGKHGPLPEAALWRLAAGLAEALRAVHAKGLIHRDLKPANVLLADNGPHVIDFGISRASSSMTQLTSAGMAIGTPGYMSPEQTQVQPVGPPSDMFSLGCVLAYAAAGRPPFDGDNPAAILFKIVGSEPDLRTVPPRFRQVIEACLKKNPAERPTPGQLVAMISQLGPATPARLGSFWPDDVARIIAAEQAAQTPAGLTPPSPISGPLPAGPAPQPAHAPMIADGYYAAAQQPSAPWAPAPPQPYVPQRPGGQTPPAQAPFGQAPYGGYPGQPYQPTPRPYPGQPQPGGAGPMGQYPMGRRTPTAAEVPPTVRTAIRLMWVGLGVTALDAVLSNVAYVGYDHDVGVDTQLGQTTAANNASGMSGAEAVTMLADYLGLACWVLLAIACRRGHSWPRIAGLMLLGIYSVSALFVLFGTHRDPGPQLTTVVVWGLGMASLIPLWSRQAREFFFAWRRR